MYSFSDPGLEHSCTDASAVGSHFSLPHASVGDRFEPCTNVQIYSTCQDRSEVPPKSHDGNEHVSTDIPKPSGIPRPVEPQPFAEPPSKRPRFAHAVDFRLSHTNARDPYGIAGGLNFSATAEAVSTELLFDRNTMLPQYGIAVPHEPVVEPTAPWTHPAVPAAGEISETTQAENEPNIEELIPDSLDFAIAKALCIPEDCILVWIGHEGSPLVSVSVPADTTVGQILQAEKHLGQFQGFTKAIDAVGSPLSAASYVYDKQIILIRPVHSSPDDRCPFVRGTQPPQMPHKITRADALWHQKGWVADDEMSFYLDSINRRTDANTTEPLVFNDNPSDQTVIGTWIVDAGNTTQTSLPFTVSTAVLFRSHWFPLHVTFDEGTTIVTTTPETQPYVELMIEQGLGSDTVSVRPQVVPQLFPADCGFQTLANILHQHDVGDQAYPMPMSEAIEWRALFAQHLRNTFQHTRCDIVFRLGGMPDANRFHDLKELVETHGVHPNRSHTVVTQLTQALGDSGIAAVLRSPKPWADLKARANAAKIKIVLAEELQKQIAKRQKENAPVGKKDNKTKAKTGKPSHLQTLKLQADQVRLPDGIFKQEDEVVLRQINHSQLQLRQPGIAVLNIENAEPFLRLTEPITTEGLAILILDAKDVQTTLPSSQISFPVSYIATQEPMILTATMLQLGKKQITRVLPPNPVTVTEVETTVVRCLVYRDLYPLDWSTIEKNPVKTIMGFDFLKGITPSMVLDVWDRQYLSKQFHRSRPDQAEIYSVTFRLTQEAAKILLEANTEAGLFIEPREPHGRAPHSAFKVVWLPKLGFKETVTAQQQTKQGSSIARSGDRFGLRVAASEVQAVHCQHRPDVTYLDSSLLRQFRVSPLPYGTTKHNLQKVCSEWKWQARPSHSVGLPGTAGLAWVVEAIENPPYWLWTMAHGDVLISEISSAKAALPEVQRPPIVASQRTLKHISTMQSPAGTVDPNDPWKHWDPWKSSPGIASTPAIPQAQIARMEANLDKKIQDALQSKTSRGDHEDDPMKEQVDTRVTQLESAVSQLTDNLHQLSGTFTQFQQKQHSHNQQVAQQFQTVQTQLEGQSSHMQKIVDNAMDEQMRRIEALLAAPSSKVARTGE